MSAPIQTVVGMLLLAAGLAGAGLESWFVLCAGAVATGEGFARLVWE